MSLTVYLNYYHTGRRRWYRRRIAGPTNAQCVTIPKETVPDSARWFRFKINSDAAHPSSLVVQYEYPVKIRENFGEGEYSGNF